MKVEYVVVLLDIPFGLMWEGSLEVSMGDYVAKISIKKKFVKEGDAGSFNNTEIKRDRQGKSSYMEAECYLDYVENKSDNFYIHRAISSINRILELYRNIYKDEYHVDKIRNVDLIRRTVRYIKKDGTTKMSIQENFPGGLILARKAKIPLEAHQMLKNGLGFPTWSNSLINAKNRLDLEDYPQAIIEANISLESFVYTHIYDRLEDEVEKEELEEFLTEYTPCKNCKHNEGSDKIILTINPSHPSIYKVIKYMYSIVPIKGLSKTKLMKLIRNINKYRNDIVHGRSQLSIKRKDAKIAVESLETFIDKSLETINNKIKLRKIF